MPLRRKSDRKKNRPSKDLDIHWVTWLCIVVLAGCTDKGKRDAEQAFLPESIQFSVGTELRIEQFCGNCHPLPAPSSFPKDHWPAEVERGFEFYFQSGRHDLDAPLMQDTVNYFQSRAPKKIELPSANEFPISPTPVQFTASPLVLSGDSISLTADIEWDQQSKSLFFSDMANSKLRRWRPLDEPSLFELTENETISLTPEHIAASGNHLCRICECDWNRDGLRDFMVAEIGSMIISDQKLGSVAVYLGREDGQLDRVVLASELARPVEAIPLDYDEDGDLDILIAEFGYNLVGCLSLLRNQTNDANAPAMDASNFQYEVIDARHGHLAIVHIDMDGDSKKDIVTAIGQEFETIQIRYNQGKGLYRNEIVLALPDPSYNTSSISVIDLDQDGRLDILHTCGDIFDSFVPKPFHGVRWARNLGEGRWEVRELGMLVGAMQTAVADFDLDGDLDVAAVGLFPASGTFSQGMSYDSVCWWEQKDNLEFTRHSVERDRCLHSSCNVADLDEDGRPDLIVGEWAEGKTPASLRIFWNRVAN